MASIAWLHVSDWHQHGRTFERSVIRDALVKDVAARAAIDPRLDQVDLMAFTGDIAFSGRAEEYTAVRHELFAPLVEAAQLTPDRVFVVPGNHDVDRRALELFSPTLLERLTDDAATAQMLTNRQSLRMLLEPFSDYEEFARLVSVFEPSERAAYSFSRHLTIGETAVRVVCLNSALFSGRNRDANGAIDDIGALVVGQPQVQPLLAPEVPADIQILLMHHPIAWCAEFERHKLRRQLAAAFDFVLHGHEHVPNVQVVEETSGRIITVPAGAGFDADANAYSHSYNYVVLDLAQSTGVVYLRRWSPVQGIWVADTESSGAGRFDFVLQTREPVLRPSRTNSAREQRDKRLETAVTAYRRAILRRYGVADHRGIAGVPGSPLAAALPADELYVVPRLVAADRSETRERERELLRLLEDPDITPAERAHCEEEYAGLTGSQWQPRQSGEETALTLGSMLRENPHIVLLGGPGVGKSALTRFLARTCVAEPDQMEQRLGWHEDLTPILQPLAAYAEARTIKPALTLRQFVLERLAEKGGQDLASAVEQQLDRAGCLMLFDGIDEIPDSRARAQLVQEVDVFLADHPNLRTVITSRPYGYIRLAGAIPHFRLPNFSADEVASFVVKYHRATERHSNPSAPDFAKADDDAHALLAEIGQNQRVSELATNPLMLVIIALIRYERAHLIEERVQLYHRAVTTLVDTWAQWRAAAGGETRREPLPHDRILRVWAAVADWMHKTRPAGVVHRRELLRELTRVIEERGFDADESAGELATKYFEVVAGSGLLEQRAEDIFAFWHPTFEEFLSAVHRCTPTGEAKKAVLALRQDPRWREVILLSVGYVGLVLLDGDTATSLVQGLWREALPPHEAFLHEYLTLAAAAVGEYPGIRRDAADQLLCGIAALLHEQAQHPAVITAWVGASRSVPRLVPSSELMTALAALEESRDWQVRMEVARLAGNAAAAGSEDCRELCARLTADDDPDVRAYAALGLLRAGESDNDTWSMALSAYLSSFAQIKISLTRLLETQSEQKLLELVASLGSSLPDLVAVCRRAGRFADSLREAAQARLGDLLTSDLGAYMRVAVMLDEPATAFAGVSAERFEEVDVDTRFDVARRLLSDREAVALAVPVLLSLLSGESVMSNSRVEALRLLPEEYVTGADIGAAFDRLRAGPTGGHNVKYAVEGALGTGTRLYAELIAYWMAGDEDAVRFAAEFSNPPHVSEREIEPSRAPQLDAQQLAAAGTPAEKWRVIASSSGPVERLEEHVQLLRVLVGQLEGDDRIAAARRLAALSEDPQDVAVLTTVLERAYADHQDGSLLLGNAIEPDRLWQLIEEHGPPAGLFQGLMLTRTLQAQGQLGRALESIRLNAATTAVDGFGMEHLATAVVDIIREQPSLASELRAWDVEGSRGARSVRALALLEIDPEEGIDELGALLELSSSPLSSAIPTDGTHDEIKDAWHALAVALWSRPSRDVLEHTTRARIADWLTARAHGATA